MASKRSLIMRAATIARDDHELLVDFQESQIPWLSARGSGGQWGTEPVRLKNPKVSDRSRAWIERSEKRAPWSREWCRAYVAETSNGIPVAGLVLESKSSGYVQTVLPEQDERDSFIYVAYLISNRDAGEESQGAGAALISLAKEQARAVGIKRLCLDCWTGNDRKLVKYYQSQGFVPVGDFVAGEKNWPGCVLEMRL